jgi:hypothetical protein
VRLWTLHPKYLDAPGLTAAWREALLARHVLLGRTRGYRNHPQLDRFRAEARPVAAINSFLAAIHAESLARGYSFDASKVGRTKRTGTMPETRGQLRYEWNHLLAKLRARDPLRYRALRGIKGPSPHPLFRIVAGTIQPWESLTRARPSPRARA